MRRGEYDRAKLDEERLDRHLDEHDAEEDEVAVDAARHVALAVHLARIDLVEDLHEHKCVEHDGKVLCGWGSQWPEGAVIDVKEARPGIYEDKHDRELVEGVAAVEEPHVAGDDGAHAAIRLSLEQLLHRGLGRERQGGHPGTAPYSDQAGLIHYHVGTGSRLGQS